MPLNLDKIKARLASFENKGKKNENSKVKEFIWKPTSGKQVIRIVPYQYQPDDPFIQMKFHYDFNGKNYLSPSTYNNPDPIVELADRLKKDKDTWKMGRALEPKLRTYVPIIVRGEEEKGVKFWGFGVTIYKQIMTAMAEPDYGDITDLNNGYDIQVEFKSADQVQKVNEDGKKFPETSIFIKPKQRPVIDPTNPKAKEIMNLITTKQPNISEVYPVSTYEELAAALEEYIAKAKAGQADESTPAPAEEDSNVVLPTEEQIAAAQEPVVTVAEVKTETPAPAVVTPTPPAKPVTSPTAAKAGSNIKELTAAFETLFPAAK
jgi:hypothetical protein